MMQNVDVRNPLCESVTTNSYRAQRGKLFEGQFHHLGSESQVAHNIARVKTMKAMRGRIALQSTSCKMPLTLAPFRPAVGDFRGACASSRRFCLRLGVWNSGLQPLFRM